MVVALDAVLGILALLGLLLGAVVLRRSLLQRGGGTLLVSLRLADRGPGRGWALGVGRFHGAELAWWRVLSLAPRPRRRFVRRDLAVHHQRPPTGPETLAVPDGATVLECRAAGSPVLLAMNDDARTGFLAWLESSPPGGHLPPRRP